MVPTPLLDSQDEIILSDAGGSSETDMSVTTDRWTTTSYHDTARHRRGGLHHRKWKPVRCSLQPPEHTLRNTVLRSILQREHYFGDYIGDDDDSHRHDDAAIRICTTNINRNLRRKLNDELAHWIIAHNQDIVVVSDPGLSEQRVEQVWMRPHGQNRPVPGLLLIGTQYIAMIINRERWENRIMKDSVVYSSSKRSMRLKIRLGRARTLWIIGTYVHHTPERHEVDTIVEWEWVQLQVAAGREEMAIVCVAGDFNTYPDEQLDRSSDGERSREATEMSQRFANWTLTHGLLSSFKSRHASTQRFTYSRGGVNSALDDIYISGEHESVIVSSGIWLRSIISSDHIGTPFVVLRCERGAHIAATVRDITPIKMVNTRTKTGAEMQEFTDNTNQLLSEGKINLIDDIDLESRTDDDIQSWLERAIDNMNDCLLESAKDLWGETNQSRRQLARWVCIKRSNRCTAQLRQVKLLTILADTRACDLRQAMTAITWPKWVLHPNQLVQGCAHEHGTRKLLVALNQIPESHSIEDWISWVETVYKQWKSIMKTRRNWRETQQRQRLRELRQHWFTDGGLKRFLRSAIGKSAPPVSIRSAMIQESSGARYTENRDEVQTELIKLLDNWIPPEEQTEPPRYLETLAPEDAMRLPIFARDWILPDIERGGRFAAYWQQDGTTWDHYVYNEDMQAEIDRQLKQHVAPGYGGVSQEMWIAAPSDIRARERTVIELILRMGRAPAILRHKQMIFLPKTATVDPTLDNTKGLSPWRPITVQYALASRLFLVAKRYVEPGIPITKMQHGFQTDRTVIDAALLVTLLTERARSLQEPLIMVSKDCLKCFDRIPKWCMDLIYRGMGVPDRPRQLMIDLLRPGAIDVRTAFGWISAGCREFGIGQGSILSILHIACYMDCLQEQLARCPDPVHIRHNQDGQGIDISSTLFVDDQLDVTTSLRGIIARSDTTNVFTGKRGTGGVFGAAKSFMMYLGASGQHHTAVELNDGLGVPRPVRVVAPEEGFKHLGIFQGGVNMWGATLSPTWMQLTVEAKRIQRSQLSVQQFRYIVNSVWIPRMRYRMVLGGAISMAGQVDTFIRQVARTVLRLPFSTPRDVYYDNLNGLGFDSCELDANVHRMQEAIRILNTPELPVYHVLVERLEEYQINAGLTDNPLSIPVQPPVHVRSWEAQLIRFASKLNPPLRCSVNWTQPLAAVSSRTNDRPLLAMTPSSHKNVVVTVNWNSTYKLRYVGDLCADFGTRLLTRQQLQDKGRWSGAKKDKVDTLYEMWKMELTEPGSFEVLEPVGCKPLPVGSTPYHMRIGVGEWIVAVTMDMTGLEPQLLHHELGYRDIGDLKQHALGTLMPVQWWYERPRGSDIWYKRTHNQLRDEFEAVCVPVTPTYLPRTAYGKDRIILWTTTRVSGVQGVNDQRILLEAAARSRLRYDTTLLHGRPLHQATACTECGRFRGERWCPSCGCWHHPNCIAGVCRTSLVVEDSNINLREASVQYAWRPGDTAITVQAGDGSVINASTPLSRGGWAIQTPSGYMVTGQLRIHRADPL